MLSLWSRRLDGSNFEKRNARERLQRSWHYSKRRIELQRKRRTISTYLQELLHEKLGGNIDVLFAGNPRVSITKLTLSTLTPLLQGIPSVAFLVAGGAFGSQSSPFNVEESLFPPSMPNNFSYRWVKDNLLVFPIQSIFPMHIDPLNLPPSLPVNRTSPIVDRVLSFDADNDIYRMQLCVFP